RQWEYRRALVYEGTGERIRSFFDKAKKRRPFTVSVIGGSVSKGRGLTPPSHLTSHSRRQAAEEASEPFTPPLGANTLYSPENMHVLIFDWLNFTFPHPGNRLINGAQGGVGAGYFGWCFKEHIPDDSDLVLLELGINDLLDLDIIESYEHLIRSILQLESRPAIINIETLTLLFPTLLQSSSLHQDVLSYYDIPSLSIRDVLLPRINEAPDEELPKWFRTGSDVHLGDSKVREWGGIPVDLMHISALGHALAASLVIRYLTGQMHPSSNWTPFRTIIPQKSSAVSRISDIPMTSLTSPFDPLSSPPIRQPHCRSLNSAKLHKPVVNGIADPTLPRVPGVQPSSSTHGWELWAWEEKHYYVARTPGAKLTVDFIVPHPMLALPPSPPQIPTDPQSSGDYQEDELGLPDIIERDTPELHYIGGGVGIAYQRSAILGLGSVRCWIDNDEENQEVVDGWWSIEERNMGMVTQIADGLEPGHHSLSCELLQHTLDPGGGHEFRLFAIMYD
ncbi:hypothetical protein TREMEDRAFT_31125, partial [Tremella mesenterica DSM 1558]|uniref:uncharacterized protein n=1 Tax=Tremella mesenterica (strain ATCC 24925 / CBS 8224 / DSM 1558 / NBRC 9311 / NRRL Y-6157 / RJB 2259-6 / UBC 559-6) TaxID=578456 RepID=UPI0003F4A481